MKTVSVTEDFLKQALQAHTALREWIKAVPDDIQLPAMPGVDGDWLDEVQAELTTALKQPMQEHVRGVVVRDELPTLIRENDARPTDQRLYTAQQAATGQEPVGGLDDTARIGWAMWRIKDLEQQLAIRPAYTAPQAATGQEPSDAQIALLDPWMRPAAAKELLTKVLALSQTTPHVETVETKICDRTLTQMPIEETEESQEDKLLTELAKCRDAMPQPLAGTSIMYAHDAAISFPIEVSSYVSASVEAMQQRDRNQQAVIDKLRKTLSDIATNEPKSWAADEALKSLDETAKQIEKSPFASQEIS